MLRRAATQRVCRGTGSAVVVGVSRRAPQPSPNTQQFQNLQPVSRITTSSSPSFLIVSTARRYCTSVACPQIAESINEGKVGQWSVKVGDAVEEDQILVEIESDKVQVPVMAPHDGVITEVLLEEGATVLVGQEMVKMKAGAAPKKEEAPAAATPAATPAAAAKPAAATSKPAATKAAAAPVQVVAAAPADSSREKRVRLTTMRLRIADRLKASQNTAAFLTTFQEINMHELIALRNRHKDEFAERHGVKLGFMSPFVCAAAKALMEVPAVNAYMDTEEGFATYHDYADISVAVATPRGLVMPVLRDCQAMSFADVEKQIGTFAEKAKAGRLTLPEMTGGTFTISNGGTYGSLFGTPIINPPQMAVLGMHATKMKPWVLADGSIAPRPIMVVALTYDHRMIDGREAVTFLVKIKNLIEDPARLVLDLA